MSRTFETVVIGAGISGLAYAHARGADADLAVLEATGEAGGWVQTERAGARGELRSERGPEALSSASAEVLALFRELSLELVPAPREARQRFLVQRGRLVPLPHSPLSFLASPLLTFRGKLRVLSEFRRESRLALDGSLTDFARHRFGQEAVEALLDPFVSGIYAGNPELLSLRATFPALARMVEEHGSVTRALLKRERGALPALSKPRDGMGALSRALAKELGPRLRLSTPVHALRRVGSRFRMFAGTEELECGRLVVATPGRAAAELLAEANSQVALALSTLTSESLVAVLHAWPRERVAHPLDGFGYLVPSRESQLQLGTLFCSSIDPGCVPKRLVLLRTLLGGARHPELVERSDAELHDIVSREVAPLLGLRGEPSWSRVVRYRNVLPRYDLAHPARLAAIDAALTRSPGLHLLGNYLRGIGVPALIESARALAREHGRAGRSSAGEASHDVVLHGVP